MFKSVHYWLKCMQSALISKQRLRSSSTSLVCTAPWSAITLSLFHMRETVCLAHYTHCRLLITLTNISNLTCWKFHLMRSALEAVCVAHSTELYKLTIYWVLHWQKCCTNLYLVRQSCAEGRHSWPIHCAPCNVLHDRNSSFLPPVQASSSPWATWSSWQYGTHIKTTHVEHAHQLIASSICKSFPAWPRYHEGVHVCKTSSLYVKASRFHSLDSTYRDIFYARMTLTQPDDYDVQIQCFGSKPKINFLDQGFWKLNK